MRLVNRRICLRFIRLLTADACSGRWSFLLARRVGCWSLEVRRLERVRAAGGAASIASSFFLDLVFATGGSCCIVAAMARAVRSRRFRACA